MTLLTEMKSRPLESIKSRPQCSYSNKKINVYRPTLYEYQVYNFVPEGGTTDSVLAQLLSVKGISLENQKAEAFEVGIEVKTTDNRGHGLHYNHGLLKVPSLHV